MVQVTARALLWVLRFVEQLDVMLLHPRLLAPTVIVHSMKLIRFPRFVQNLLGARNFSSQKVRQSPLDIVISSRPEGP